MVCRTERRQCLDELRWRREISREGEVLGREWCYKKIEGKR